MNRHRRRRRLLGSTDPRAIAWIRYRRAASATNIVLGEPGGMMPKQDAPAKYPAVLDGNSGVIAISTIADATP